MKQYFWLACFLMLVTTPLLAQKKKITRADELPRRMLPLSGKVMDIYRDDARLNTLAAQIYANYRQDLEQFDIQDKATREAYESAFIVLDQMAGRYDAIPARLETLRELEDKAQEKAFTGMTMYAWLAAVQEFPDRTSPGFKKAFKQHLQANVANMDPQYRRTYLDKQKANWQLQNPELIFASMENQLQPFIDNGKGQVPEAVVYSIIANKSFIEYTYPLKEQILDVLNAFADNTGPDGTTARKDLWQERKADLSGARGTEVVLAVWDTGVDPEIFQQQLFINRSEQKNGKDDDGNGHVDDLHGLAYDRFNRPAQGWLLEKREIRYPLAELQAWMKGVMDMQSGITSSEATAVQQKFATLTREDAVPFQEDLSWYSTYAHGTHVAGIALDGNPFARLMITRLAYDTKAVPDLPEEAESQNAARMYGEVVAYYRKHGVKVVNMSWRYNSLRYEALFNMYGVGADEAERKKLANAWFNREKAALRDAIAAAPDILFVCGSGNESNDASFADYIPAGLDLPNLITVGAVDSEGKRTAFTTEGERVKLYANGYEVESYVPGGARIRFSGTSMASPQVANLAAKMLALNPELRPGQLIKLLEETATGSPESETIRLIHPRKALEAAIRARKDFTEKMVNQLLASQ